ncbi:RCC1 domain-containing protein [Pseudomonas iridis]|uniref:RCC1 domain-containing protein n=1 Tax=Pseudomonas iridis TaxID=2710587 RepID=A0ABW8DKS8_9PSED
MVDIENRTRVVETNLSALPTDRSSENLAHLSDLTGAQFNHPAFNHSIAFALEPVPMSANYPSENSTLTLQELDIPGRTGPVSEEPKIWGINRAAAWENFPRQGLSCRPEQWGEMNIGDLLLIFIGEQQVLRKVISERELGKRLQMFVPSALINEGLFGVYYTVTRLNQVPEHSETTQVLCKFTRPGGHDEYDGSGHSKLIMSIPPEILADGINKENVAAGFPVSVGRADGSPAYPFAAAGDQIHLIVGGVFVLSEPLTQDQADGKTPIIIHIDEATLREAGDSDAIGLAVAFEVYDLVDNRSEDWSFEQRVVVAIDTDRLAAPLLEQADNNNVLDVDRLGTADGTAQILALDSRYQVNDNITLCLKGMPVEGGPIDEKYCAKLTKVPGVLNITVPNAVLRQLANSKIEIYFLLESPDHTRKLRSKTLFISAIGEVQRLAAPVIRDASDGALDPTLEQVAILIPFDKSFVAGQSIELRWLVTRPDLSHYLPDLPLRTITDGDIRAEEPLRINVPGDPHLITGDGGTVEAFYFLHVSNAALSKMNRVNATHATRESIHAEILQIGEPRLELPEPEVAGIVDGVMPPDRDGTTLTVTYLNTQPRDVVTYFWSSPKTGTASDSITLSSITAGKPIQFTIGAGLIKDNDGEIVKTSYLITRAAGGTSYSNPLTFRVGEVLDPQMIVIGHRSQAGPRYHANLSRLSVFSADQNEALWIYEGDSEGVTAASFLDTEPQKALTVTLPTATRASTSVVLRPANVHGVVNLSNRFSGCIVKDDGTLFGWSQNSEMLPPADAQDVRYVVAGGSAFAALRRDGTVFAWGAALLGGRIPPEIGAKLNDVKKIASSAGAFVALLNDGSLVAWGDPDFGGKIPDTVSPHLTAVLHVIGSTADFSAVLQDGRVFSWGATWPTGLQVTAARGALHISASDRAFAVIKADQRVAAWGSDEHGGAIAAETAKLLTNVSALASTSAAFAALKMDGSVVTWGNPRFGGAPQETLHNVQHVVGSTTAFCALRTDGSLAAWGEPNEGGALPGGLGKTLSLSASYASFCAIQDDHSAISWGINPSTEHLPGMTCVYPAGRHWVALGEQKTLHAWGPGAPDLDLLTGEVSYTE